MATAKRLYLYIVSAVGLGLALGGLTTLLRLLLDRLGLGPASTLVAGSTDQSDREALSLAMTLVVVGLPLWLIHWGYLERMMLARGADAAAERRSIVRSLFFGLALFSTLTWAAASWTDFLREAIANQLSARDTYGNTDLAGSLASGMILGGAWAYHAWIRARDIRGGPVIGGAAAWLSRLYLYGVAFIGVVVVMTSAATIIEVIADNAAGYGAYSYYGYYPYGYNEVGATAPWWVRPILAAVVQAIVWGLIWAGHFRYSNRIRVWGDEQAEAESTSRMRLAFFIGVIAFGVGYVASSFGAGLGAALSSIVQPSSISIGATVSPLWRSVLGPPLTALLPAAAWWWHRRRARQEAAGRPGSVALLPIRLAGYVTALIGLAYFAAAMTNLLELLLERGFGPVPIGSVPDDWAVQAAWAIGTAVVALPLWLWPWLTSRRRLLLDLAGEARCSPRRYYLFVVVGATVLATTGGLAAIVYRLSRTSVGLQAGSFSSEVGYPIAILLVAVPLLVYHTLALRHDLAVTAGAELVSAGVMPQPVVVPYVAAPAAVGAPTEELVISGPAGADLEALRSAIAGRLPAGYSMQIRDASGAPTKG